MLYDLADPFSNPYLWRGRNQRIGHADIWKCDACELAMGACYGGMGVDACGKAQPLEESSEHGGSPSRTVDGGSPAHLNVAQDRHYCHVHVFTNVVLCL